MPFLPGKGFSLCDDNYYYCAATNTIINSGLKDIYFKYRKDREIEIDEVDVNPESVKSSVRNLKQVIFEITQRCNLECAYCIYESGEYVNFRPGSSKAMEFDTAKKTLDHIWRIINERENKKITIGFYGGEPLLNFPVIEKTVDYAENLFCDWDLLFTITTNGVLLDDPIIDFLVDHGFSTHVSLDGPEENHDAKRVFRDGTGSYRFVIENLAKIKSKNAGYYEKNVFISTVHSKDLSFKKMFDFFSENDLVKNIDIKLGFVTESGASYYSTYPYDLSTFRNNFDNAFQSAVEKKREKKDVSSIESYLLTNFDIFFKPLEKNRFNSLMGTCFYDSRLYVDADGGFHVCEKINDKFQFGNANSGFDYEKMADITRNYLELLKKCRLCDVKFLCQKCYIHFAKDGVFEMSEEFCSRAKRKIKKMLEDWIRLKEGEETECVN